jgi:hypothetical protein
VHTLKVVTKSKYVTDVNFPAQGLFGAVVISVLALDTNVEGSNPAKAMDF